MATAARGALASMARATDAGGDALVTLTANTAGDGRSVIVVAGNPPNLQLYFTTRNATTFGAITLGGQSRSDTSGETQEAVDVRSLSAIASFVERGIGRSSA